MSDYDKTMLKAQDRLLVTREVEAGDISGGWAQVSVDATGSDGGIVICSLYVLNESAADAVDYELQVSLDGTNFKTVESGTVPALDDSGLIVHDTLATKVALRVSKASKIALGVRR